MPISQLLRTRSQEVSTTRRPWSELFSHPSSYSFPSSLGEFSSRFRRNFNHFRVNYVEIVLSAPLVSYTLHPIQFTVFFIVLVVWLYMYLFREHQLVVLNRLVNNDRVVILTLVFFTDFAVVPGGGGLNVLVSYIVGWAMVVLHASFRKSEDMFLDEEEAAEGGLVSAVGSNDEPSPPATDTRILIT